MSAPVTSLVGWPRYWRWSNSRRSWEERLGALALLLTGAAIYWFGSRLVAFGIATVVALGCAGGVWLLAPWLNDYLVVPLYLACISLPAYGLANTQDGIARRRHAASRRWGGRPCPNHAQIPWPSWQPASLACQHGCPTQ